MGTLKKHLVAFAIEQSQLNIRSSYGNVDTSPWKGLNGTEKSTMMCNSSNTDLVQVQGAGNWLTPVATADTLVNYSFEDYTIAGIGSCTYSTNRQIVTDAANHKYECHLTYTITISNSGSDAITVNCIRFKKKVQYGASSSNYLESLLYSYYLDNPLTVAAGDSETVAVDFCVSNQGV